MKNFLLSDGEKIVYEIKPNKKRFVYIQILFFCLLHFVIIALCAIPIIVNIVNKQSIISCWYWFFLIGVSFFVCLFSCIARNVRYKKRSYYVTNKRLIISSGFIGLDYKSIPLNTVMSQDVRVDFLDKWVKPNTGTIFFANPSSPIIYNSLNDKGRTSTFCFSNIDNPYDWFNKIKKVIDSSYKKS